MKISVIAFAIAAVAGTYGIVHYGNARQEGPTAMTQPTTMARDARADVQRLEAELMAMRGAIASRDSRSRDSRTSTNFAAGESGGESGTPTKLGTSTGSSRAMTGTADVVPADPRMNPEAQAEAEQRFDEHVATVAANFHSEPRDPPFAITTSDSLKSVLGSEELAKVPVHNIDCRTLTCRVEINDDGSGVVAQALPILAVRMADTLPNVLAQRLEQPNGHATMVLYMSK